MIQLTNCHLKNMGTGFQQLIKDWLTGLNHSISTIEIECNPLETNLKGNVYLDDSSFKDQVAIDSLEKVNFREVTGFFICHNTNLKSLKGVAKTIGGNFICINNKELKSLKGCPKKVGGDFIFYGNAIEFSIEELEKLREKVEGEIILMPHSDLDSAG